MELHPLTFGLVTLVTFLAMELVANWTHRYIMHGPLWFLHRDHHQTHKGFWQRNDWFFLIFSIPSGVILAIGIGESDHLFLALGAGQCLYGLFYLFVHDIYVHDRFKLRLKPKSPYINRLRSHHWQHHNCLTRKNATNFGFLWAPAKSDLEVQAKTSA